MNQDHEHLQLLSVFHYVIGGITALFSLFPIFHLIFGLVMVLAPGKIEGNGGAPPAFIGWFFVIVAGAFIAVGWMIAAAIIATGRFLAKRKHHLFCLIVAGFECLLMPIGTVLGVFTIIVLMRESVKQSFLTDQRFDAGVPEPYP